MGKTGESQRKCMNKMEILIKRGKTYKETKNKFWS